jgi:hypothetical protein
MVLLPEHRGVDRPRDFIFIGVTREYVVTVKADDLVSETFIDYSRCEQNAGALRETSQSVQDIPPILIRGQPIVDDHGHGTGA